MNHILRVAAVSLVATTASSAVADEVRRQWNEVTLESIRNDFARPIVHARNLFHVSSAMFDAWSAFDDVSEPWLIDVDGTTTGDLEQDRSRSPMRPSRSCRIVSRTRRGPRPCSPSTST